MVQNLRHTDSGSQKDFVFDKTSVFRYLSLRKFSLFGE